MRRIVSVPWFLLGDPLLRYASPLGVNSTSSADMEKQRSKRMKAANLKPEIPNFKFEISNKLQAPKLKFQTGNEGLWCWDVLRVEARLICLEFSKLFIVICLEFRICNLKIAFV